METEDQLIKRIEKTEKFKNNFYVWVTGVMLFLFVWEVLLIIIPELLKHFEIAIVNEPTGGNIIIVIILIIWTFYNFALRNIGAGLEH